METKRNWIGLKDVILITLLTALCLVIFTIVIIPFSANAKLVLWVVSGIQFLLCGPVFVLMCAKSPRRGTLVLFAFLLSIYYFFTNGMIAISLMIFGIGIVMELIAIGSGYKKPLGLTIAYALLAVGIMMSPVVLIFSNKASLTQQMLGSGLPQEYIDTMFATYSPLNITIGVVGAIIGACLGFFIGYRLLKKHFDPAGIVEKE